MLVHAIHLGLDLSENKFNFVNLVGCVWLIFKSLPSSTFLVVYCRFKVECNKSI